MGNAVGFWNRAKEVTENLPGNLKVQSVYPSRDGKTGTCIWEADSAQDVQQFLDKNAGDFAKNYCYEVDMEQAMGLPKVQLEDAVHG